MEKIDTSTNSKRIQEPYNKVVRGDPSISYVVYSVDKNATLDVSETGDGPLEEFVEQFTDGQVQFGLARVTVPGSDVFKNLLLGWCPDNAPAKLRLSFANNFAEVSKIFSGYHIQITARDQDDLDVDEFLSRVAAAAGARYSTTPGSSSKKSTPTPSVSKTTVSKPITPKPASSTSKPSFIPKSTGFGKSEKPKSSNDDGWGDAQDVEERDFDEKPLENVPSTYKPTKVNINDLRKQKSDTISSTPKSKTTETKKSEENDDKPKPLSERLKAYDHNDDGRLTSLPKPKIGHSVADKYKANASSSGSTPSFGAKPSFGSNNNTNKADKVSGGLSRDFGAENGKTPAQIWAEKRGKYKTVTSDEDEKDDNKPSQNFQSHASELANKFEKQANLNDDNQDEEEEEEEEEKPAPLPARNFPPPPKRQPIPEPEEDEEDEEEDEKPAKFSARNLPPPPPRQPEPEDEEDEEEDDDEKPARLPARNIPPPTSFGEDDDEEEDEEDEKPATLPRRNLPPPPQAQAEPEEEPEEEQEEPESKPQTNSGSNTAIAEYDYEKDEDNEIGFEEGDLIVEIDFVDEDWWSGKHSKTGEIGLFPANYVTLQE
ncbi:ABP1 [Candida pseudojiufengensis]|uniref:ABP1 n=1 Tax=Candida pseudojiufengensis TaxID=497109 RepID=UPI002224372D|nr:ABP1 [Candida pseudojiufengensis]KAI5965754.1 ABP1 [Candida pseudojiufengensis]